MSTLNTSLALYDRTSVSMQVLSKMADTASMKFDQTNISVNNLNKSLKNTESKADLILDVIKNGMKMADEYTRVQTRIKAVNNELGVQENLQEKIFAAANRSRTSYSNIVRTFSDLKGMTNSSLSNDEALGFSELMHKSYKLGGTDDATQSAGIDQVIKSMGTGTVDDGVFDNITKNAPAILKAMESFTGKSKLELSKMAAEGTLTADLLKNAMFAASNDINSEFSNLPMKFSEVLDRIRNVTIEAFGGVIESISSFMGSSEFEPYLNSIILGIYAIGSVLSWLVDSIIGAWDIIGPILFALAISYLNGLRTKLLALIPALWGMVSPILAQAAGWIAASWPILLIVAAVAAIIFVLGKLGVTAQSVFGFIFGLASALVAIFLDIPVYIQNAFIGAIKLIDLFITSLINKFISKINFLIEILSGLELIDVNPIDKFKGFTEGLEYKKTFNYSEVFEKGSNVGKGLYDAGKNKIGDIKDQISSFTNGFGLGTDGSNTFGYGGSDASNIPGFSGSSDLGTPSNPVSVQGTGSNGNLAVDMAEEDIQYLRDIAERDYINKFSTATVAPNIQVSFGDIHKEADADKVAGRIQRILREQIATAGEGVY
ncbi:tape measure protein [Anoxybacterium hadale]|uniref:Tape measure protein n=1 Tax=Anoxybacterium hadale TaxID=3408580 RepID=A0ACD1AB54_9FIRM|nr:tape measure protein [Clostridiales bacterium]